MNIAKGKLLAGYFATLGDNRAVPALLAIHPILLKSESVGEVVFSMSLVPTSANAEDHLMHAFQRLGDATADRSN